MGARGANIQKVCSDFNVQIKIPDRKSSKAQPNGITNGQDEDTNGHDNSDIIRISGRKENCEDPQIASTANILDEELCYFRIQMVRLLLNVISYGIE